MVNVEGGLHKDFVLMSCFTIRAEPTRTRPTSWSSMWSWSFQQLSEACAPPLLHGSSESPSVQSFSCSLFQEHPSRSPWIQKLTTLLVFGWTIPATVKRPSWLVQMFLLRVVCYIKWKTSFSQSLFPKMHWGPVSDASSGRKESYAATCPIR